jgi:integrase
VDLHPDEERALRDLFPTFKKSGSVSTKKERTEYLERVKRQVEDRVYNLRAGRAVGDNRPWDFHVKEFLAYGKTLGGLKGTAWAPGTYRIRKDALLKYWTPLLKPKNLQDIRREDVMRAVQHMVEEGLASSTINGRITSLKSLMSRAKDLSHIEKNPLDGIYVTSRVKQPRGHFTPAELQLLFSQTPLNDSLAYQLAYYCRFRGGELKKLTVGSVSWIERHIDLPGIQADGSAGTKNKTDAYQAIPDRLWPVLWDYCAGRAAEEPLLKGFPPRHHQLTLYRHMERLGIPKVHKGLPRTFHSLGHSTATNALRLGVRADLVQSLMRHADIKETMGYVTREMEEAQGAVNLMDRQLFPDFKQENTTPKLHEEGLMKVGAYAGQGLSASDGGRGEIHPEGKKGKLIAFPGRKRAVSYTKAHTIATQALHKIGEDPIYAEALRTVLAMKPEDARRLAESKKSNRANG